MNDETEMIPSRIKPTLSKFNCGDRFDDLIYENHTINTTTFYHCVFNKNTFKNITFSHCVFKNCMFRDNLFTDVLFRRCIFMGGDIIQPDSILTFEDCSLKNMVIHSKEGINFINCETSELSLAGRDIPITGIPLICPEEGSFIGWKKCYSQDLASRFPVLVKLEICETAKRSSGARTRKCRCDRAYILDIISLDGKTHYTEAYSFWDPNFKYEVGKIVQVSDFCDIRWKECAPGIHFFITKQEAIDFEL